ncbi:MAG: hypothetical protein RL095_458 [Verrucomicrobiota bacterium]|jgi:hypothetical protein
MSKKDSLFRSDAPRSFKDAELQRIAKFLKDRHTPRPLPAVAASPTVATPPSPARAAAPLPQSPPALAKPATAAPAPATPSTIRPQKSPGCSKCPAPLGHLEIQYGKYGYYFKCRACEGNTPIDFSCPACRREAKLRKDGPRFYWNCDPAKGGCGFDKLGLTHP